MLVQNVPNPFSSSQLNHLLMILSLMDDRFQSKQRWYNLSLNFSFHYNFKFWIFDDQNIPKFVCPVFNIPHHKSNNKTSFHDKSSQLYKGWTIQGLLCTVGTFSIRDVSYKHPNSLPLEIFYLRSSNQHMQNKDIDLYNRWQESHLP